MDVRSRILDSALGLVLESGVAALTQPKIARAAGLRQSHLTYYFPTRAELLQSVVQHMMDAMVSGIAQRTSAGKTGPGRRGGAGAAALLRGLAEGVSDPRRARLMLALVVASDEQASTKRWLRDFVATLRGRLAALLEAAGLDGSRAAEMHMMLVGAAILNVARDDAASRREARRAAATALQVFGARAQTVRAGRRSGGAA